MLGLISVGHVGVLACSFACSVVCLFVCWVFVGWIGWFAFWVTMEENSTLVAQMCFQKIEFETDVSNSNQIILVRDSFSKTRFLQREPFLTMCYTINSSPLLVTK